MWSPTLSPASRNTWLSALARELSSANVVISPVEAMITAGRSGVCIATDPGNINANYSMQVKKQQSENIVNYTVDLLM